MSKMFHQATAGRSATEISGFTLRAASFALLIDGGQTGAPRGTISIPDSIKCVNETARLLRVENVRLEVPVRGGIAFDPLEVRPIQWNSNATD